MRKTIVILTILVLIPAVGANAVSLEKRHQLGLRLGMWNQTTDTRTEVDLSGVSTSVDNNGALGGIFYSNWLTEQLALTFSISGSAFDISSDAGSLGVTSETSSVGSMLMGVKYYFVPSTLQSSVRPYLKGSAGPFIGDQSTNRVGTTVVSEQRTEYAFGGQVGAGVDFITSRHFMMGIGFGYNLMTDFDQTIGGSRNYSGPEFGFEFSWLFGHGKQ